ncbi:pentapeptide repeat-containing protein [Streptomyces sp. NPDC059696]|uniref:pentapeptide repeat-containing protein n=1 Tax=Streptomyces sp. NPDC059696 TaxID=3346911 RepID=UPI0036B89C9C
MAWKPNRTQLRNVAARRTKRRQHPSRQEGVAGAGGMRWGGLIAASLPGLAALLALLFTWMQVSQTNKELAITERGQITSRFNSAVTNLSSTSLDARLGGVFALEQIMHDSPNYQSTIVSILTAYMREHAPTSERDLEEVGDPYGSDSVDPPPPDIYAAFVALASRNAERDRFSLDLRQTKIRGLEPPPTKKYRGTLFEESDLSSSQLVNLDLRDARLYKSNLSGAAIWESDFSDADLQAVNAVGADFCQGFPAEKGIKYGDYRCETKFTDTVLAGANLSQADLVGADLSSATLCIEPDEVFERECPNLTGAYLNAAKLKSANLSEANLRGADLSGADLTAADLSKADLTNADLTGAKTTGADFSGAKTKGARGLPTSR